jgi:uncharacterized protein YndB with AHSA1/START domain
MMATATKAKATSAKGSTLTTPTDRTIHVERVFDASRDRVWKAHTDPKLLAQWWGRGNKLVIEKYELKKGGHWRFVEHSEGGEHGFEGRFREITPQERLSMTFEWDGMPGYPSVQTLTLEDMGDGRTLLKSDVQFYTPEERDGMMSSGMEGGMNQSFEALDRVLASMG